MIHNCIDNLVASDEVFETKPNNLKYRIYFCKCCHKNYIKRLNMIIEIKRNYETGEFEQKNVRKI